MQILRIFGFAKRARQRFTGACRLFRSALRSTAIGPGPMAIHTGNKPVA